VVPSVTLYIRRGSVNYCVHMTVVVSERVHNINSFPSLFYLTCVFTLIATGNLICWLTTQNYDIELQKEY
jgi:hypothetical protein